MSRTGEVEAAGLGAGWLSPNPAKAAVERWYLVFTPVWAVIVGGLMISGIVEGWGNVPTMILGVGLAVGAVVPPVVFRVDRDVPWWRSTAAVIGAAVTLLALGLNYTQTPFFFDVLHMHYGFDVTWVIDRNPVFLYFLSVAYFATYFALCTVAWRFLQRQRSRVVRASAWVVAPMGMAGLETALNANPFTTSLFCYDDLPFMLWFGTLVYGLAFVLVLPAWAGVDERAGERTPRWQPIAWTLGALYVDLVVLAILRAWVAPWLTTVVDDAPGLRDFATSCLVGPG